METKGGIEGVAMQTGGDVGATDVELYGHSAGLMRFPFGSTTTLLYNPYDRTCHLVSADEDGVLQLCRDLSTLGEHVARCLQVGKLDETSIRSILQRMADEGLLVARTDLAARCLAHKAHNGSSAQIASLGIPTRNRPEMLQRCVESYAQCARDFSRHVDFLVVDSSDDASVRERNVDALSVLQKRYGVAIHYLGHDERRDFAHRLAGRGVDPRCVDFALFNPDRFPNDFGANRNALLLSTVDECTVQVDDDTLCRVMPGIATTKGVRFTSNFDPTEFAFVDQDENIPAERSERRDFFALHEMLLAKSPGELIELHGLEAKGFDRPTGIFFRGMELGIASVSTTSLGVAGDSGMAVSTHFMQLDGDSRAKLMRSEHAYRTALSGHRLIRSVPHLTVSERAYCMALNLGLDNRRLLPPFMPVQRGEDIVFGTLVAASGGGGCFGFLPWALVHDPPSRQRPDIAAVSARMPINQTLVSILRLFRPAHANGPDENLLALGQWLCDLGRGSMEDFEEFARILAWQQAGQQIAQMEGLLHRHGGQPQFWAADVARYIAALKASIAAARYVAPLELEERFGADSALPWLQRIVMSVGELLQAWPDLREAARQERACGNAIARRI